MIKTVRCDNCGKKLAEMEYGKVWIKCNKCGTVNEKKIESIIPREPKILHIPKQDSIIR